MITLDRVNKSFHGVRAVRDLSLSVKEGEIFGLAGPNGAGKTTTLRMLTGLLRPDDGSVFIGPHNIVSEPLRAKALLGYVPDKSFLYEKLTAREFLVFIAALYGLGRAEASARVSELLDIFGIRDLEDELIQGYSQGMRQRLLFASALVHGPSVLLIDEPFVGLDPFGVRMLKELIAGLGRNGTCIFLATHSLHIAEELCHRVGFIRKGSLLAVKSREEIRETEGGLEGLFLSMNQ